MKKFVTKNTVTQVFAKFIILLLIPNVFAEAELIQFGDGEIVFLEQRLAIEVETAITEKQRTKGLMHRDSLSSTKGMLFVFEQEVIQRVWMKNTLIPLDIIFVSKQGIIVSTIEDLQPCIIKSCDIYNSTKPAKYMLEIKSGMLRSNGIKDGQRVIIKFSPLTQ